jgi:glyoxylase-like metal-dependent hydrolase (beta-lactamase superfamily II)
MDVKVIEVGPLATNCYVLTAGDRCLVIDPGDEADRILAALDGFKVQAILLTHGHFDHTSAAAYLQEKTAAPVFVGAPDRALLDDPGWMKQFMSTDAGTISDVRTLAEGDKVQLGETVLEVWETPGHSAGSLSFISNEAQGFCGDLIFREGVGRTDLPGGDPDRLFESVDRVLKLPGKTAIYPGHGPRTTVAHENAANPFR